MKGINVITPDSGETANYDLANYPSVRHHLIYDAALGRLVDEVSGSYFDVNECGLTTVDPNYLGISGLWLIQNDSLYFLSSGNFSTIHLSTKTVVFITVACPTVPDTLRSSGIGGANDVAQCATINGIDEHYIFMSINNNAGLGTAHYTAIDDASTPMVAYKSPEFTDTLPEDQLWAGSLVMTATHNHGTIYDQTGSVFWDYENDNAVDEPMGDLTPGRGRRFKGGTAIALQIVYEFTVAPTADEIKLATLYHLGAAANGWNAAPYPGWKGRA